MARAAPVPRAAGDKGVAAVSSPTPWFRCRRDQWYATLNGKQVALGVHGPDGQAAAVAALAQLMRAAGLDPAALAAPPPPALTCRQAAEAVLAAKRGLVKPHTLYVYGQHLAHFRGRFADRPVNGLTAAEVEASARRPSWSDSTRRGYLVAVSVCLRHAGVTLTLRKPPCRSAGAKSVVTPEVYAKALDAAAPLGDLRALLVVLWHTGARPSEATGLRAADVDWANCTATLHDHKTASKGRPRLLVFPPPAMGELEALRAKHPSGWLFRTERGRRWSKVWLSQVMAELSRAVGHRVTAKGFRHSFATRALEASTPEHVVAALLGHSGTDMLARHYAHVNANSRLLKDAAARLAG